MYRNELFYKMNRLLEARFTVSRRIFLEEHEVSSATYTRGLNYLCDQLNVPVVWDRNHNG